MTLQFIFDQIKLVTFVYICSGMELLKGWGGAGPPTFEKYIVGANRSHRYYSPEKWLGLRPNTQSEDKSVSENDKLKKKWKLYYRKR